MGRFKAWTRSVSTHSVGAPCSELSVSEVLCRALARDLRRAMRKTQTTGTTTAFHRATAGQQQQQHKPATTTQLHRGNFGKGLALANSEEDDRLLVQNLKASVFAGCRQVLRT